MCAFLMAGLVTLMSEACRGEYVGDITSKEKMEFPLKLCGYERDLLQYYQCQGWFTDDGGSLLRDYQKVIADVDTAFSGWVRVRFVVNCKGQSGRYLMTAIGVNYEAQELDQKLTSLVLDETKLRKWEKMRDKHGKNRDYYMYILLHFEEGELINIYP